MQNLENTRHVGDGNKIKTLTMCELWHHTPTCMQIHVHSTKHDCSPLLVAPMHVVFRSKGRDMGSAGTVRRFTDALQLFFQLSDVPKAKRVLHARLYLEGLAADCVSIAMRTMPESDGSDWPKFCALLSIRFGQIDPDAEFWDQLCNLKQGVLSVAEYVHKMRYCFNLCWRED